MKKILLIAAVSFILVACDKNIDNPEIRGEAAKITATIGQSASSRASGASWAPGDKIGISSKVGTISGPYVNLQYTTDQGDGIFIGTPIYFYKPMVLSAYYPYTGTEGTVPGTDGKIPVNTAGDKQTTSNHPSFDFLWASKDDINASDPVINFVFSHKMSKLTFAFKGCEEEKEDGVVVVPEVKTSNMISYVVEGLVLDGTFDTATGICAINPNGEAKDLTINVTKGSVSDEQELTPLIVIPQKPGNQKVKLHVYTDELNNPDYLQHYVCTLTFGDGELKPGNSYKYTVQITKVGLKIGSLTIEPWTTERDVNITATIDGDGNNNNQ